MRSFQIYLKKDFAVLLRSKEVVSQFAYSNLAVILLTLLLFSAAGLGVTQRLQILPPLLIAFFILLNCFLLPLTIDSELSRQAIKRVRSLGADLTLYFLSKCLVIGLTIWGSFIATLLLANLVFVGLPLIVSAQLSLAVLPLIISFVLLGLLLTFLVFSGQRSNRFLIPLLLVPLLFPVMVTTLEIFQRICFNSPLPSVSLLLYACSLAAIKFLIAVFLFEYTLED